MSTAEIIVILLGLAVILAIIKFVKGTVRIIITLLMMCLTCLALILYVPESKLSMLLTESIAKHIAIDSDNEYADGELIKEFDSTSIDLGNPLLNTVTRQAALAVSKTKVDSVLLKDAVIYFDVTLDGVEISIYKIE